MSYSLRSFLWTHIRPYKGFYAVMALASLVTGFYAFANNYAIKQFLDLMEGREDISYGELLAPILLFLGAQLILDLVWRISDLAQRKSEPYVRQSILVTSYHYVQQHSYRFFLDTHTGAIASKLKGLIDGYDKFWSECHHGLMPRTCSVVIGIAALFLVNIRLGIFLCVWSVVYTALIATLSKRLNDLSQTETESRHTLIGQVSDKITNIMTIFSFASRKRELDQLDHHIVTDFIPKQLKTYRYNFKFQLVGGLLYLLVLTALLFYMIHLRKEGVVSLGDFAFVFGITLHTIENIWEITVSLQDFARSMGDFRSALSLLNHPHESLDPPGATPLLVTQGKIEFQDIHFHYDRTRSVLKGLTLTLEPGEKVGIIGPSGAGKSSLINLLLRYFSPEKGAIIIDGQDIQGVTQDSLREQIAVIPQDTVLFHRTILENIKYGNPSATLEDVIDVARKVQLHDFIMGLPQQYHSEVGERGLKLSGGQRQRLAVARGLIKKAPILILDEATSSLDSETEKAIQKSLKHVFQDKSRTVIAVAHRLSTLKNMDRLVVITQGRLVEEGTHDILLKSQSSLYRKLWELQA